MYHFRDPVVEQVVSQFVDRSNVGYKKYKQTLDSYTKDSGSETINIPTIYDDRKTMVTKWNAISTDDLLSIDHRVVMFEDTYRKILRGRNNV